MSCIYKITNKLTGKRYVGQTRNTAEHRYRDHLYNAFVAKLDLPLYREMRKYGGENFSLSVLEYCEPEELNDREIYWIGEEHSFGEQGYNATAGGQGSTGHTLTEACRKYIGWKSRHRSPESNFQIAEKMVSRKLSEQEKQVRRTHMKKASEVARAWHKSPEGIAYHKRLAQKIQEQKTYSYAKVKSIEFCGYEDVYNMEVQDTHNFTVNGGCVVHNSMDAMRYCLERLEQENFSF